MSLNFKNNMNLLGMKVKNVDVWSEGDSPSASTNFQLVKELTSLHLHAFLNSSFLHKKKPLRCFCYTQGVNF